MASMALPSSISVCSSPASGQAAFAGTVAISLPLKSLQQSGRQYWREETCMQCVQCAHR
jgi:hypothetical protein